MVAKVLICIPTYNEIENIESILKRVLSVRQPILDENKNVNEIHVLVIDDASPDGTSARVKELQFPKVDILDRTEKAGLGPAYIAGFAWGKSHGFTHVVEMDADGSHQPEELHRLLAKITEADLILGTRWMPGGRVENWPFRRKLLSLMGTKYASKALKLPYKDLTGGYRVLSSDLLEKVDLSQIQSKGYGFQIEMVMRSADIRARIVQVPITFIDRTLGTSKMNGAIAIEALGQITKWGFERRISAVRRSLMHN